MNPFKTDVSVLILFFNRPDSLQQVFEQVKTARPSRLFLYQDGPRNQDDMPKVDACRKIVDDIDWRCEVHKLFQEKNYGCDPSEYLAQKWAFSLSDKCIVLEDDDVPSQSFFTFCKEMLDKYENDERVFMISGLNIDEISEDIPYDYFFSSVFSIWGWASWKRVIDLWDENYTFLNNKTEMKLLKDYLKKRNIREDFIKCCTDHKNSGKAFYETIFWSSMIFNNASAIIPKKNMISNIGMTNDSTHFSGNLRTLPKKYRKVFTMKRFDIDFPLNHPLSLIENVNYKERFYNVNSWNVPIKKFLRSFEILFHCIRAGNFKILFNLFKDKIKRIIFSKTHK